MADKNGASSSVGYGSDSDSQSSITKSGINTRNIHITDEAGQLARTGRTAKETEARIYTGIDTETADQHTGRLKNSFDKDAVQSELDLQRTVSQDFSKNVQQANTEINQHLDKLKADKEAAKTAAAEALADGDMETAKRKAHEAQDAAAKADNWQQGKVILNMLASGLAAPTQSGAGIAVATASPAVSYAIGQHFKDLAGQNANGKLTASQETAHVLAHAVLGAAVAAAGDNNALAGALSAGRSEAAAPYISKWLYGKEKGSDLTAEEKETVSAITNVLGTATGAAVGNSATDGAQGSLNAKSAVGNNEHTVNLQTFGITPESATVMNNQGISEVSKCGFSSDYVACVDKYKNSLQQYPEINLAVEGAGYMGVGGSGKLEIFINRNNFAIQGEGALGIGLGFKGKIGFSNYLKPTIDSGGVTAYAKDKWYENYNTNVRPNDDSALVYTKGNAEVNIPIVKGNYEAIAAREYLPNGKAGRLYKYRGTVVEGKTQWGVSALINWDIFGYRTPKYRLERK